MTDSPTSTDSVRHVTDEERRTAPAVHEFDRLDLPAMSDERISDSVTLHTVHDPQSQIVRADIVFGRSALCCPDDRRRAAIIIARKAAVEGTASHTGAQIAEAIDFEGAWLNAPTGGYYTTFGTLSRNESLPRVLVLSEDIFANASFPDAAVESARRQCIMKIRGDKTRIEGIAARESGRLMNGPEHPYSIDLDEEDFLAVTRDDVLAAFHDLTRHSELHVFAAGNLDAKTMGVLRDFATRLDAYAGTPKTYPIVPADPVEPCRSHIAVEGSMQTAISLGLPVSIGRHHPEYIPLRLSVIALGGYFGSRLMTNIREEKGLTYGIRSSLVGSREGTALVIEARCKGGDGALAISETFKEIDRMRTELMSADELERLRRYSMSALASTLETPMSVLEYYLTHYQVGTPDDYFDRQFRHLRELRAETVMEMASKYLDPSRLIIVTAGAEP